MSAHKECKAFDGPHSYKPPSPRGREWVPGPQCRRRAESRQDPREALTETPLVLTSGNGRGGEGRGSWSWMAVGSSPSSLSIVSVTLGSLLGLPELRLSYL